MPTHSVTMATHYVRTASVAEPIVFSRLPSNPLEQLLQTAYSLFNRDQTVLVPMNGSKCVDGCQTGLTLQEAHRPANEWLLACYDIGVVCGPRSHNLACIRFHDSAKRSEFLAKNPALQSALITSSPQGLFVWVRIDGWCPPCNHEHPLCDWISEKIVLIATREQRSEYRFDNQAQPALVKFNQIVWPDDLAIYWALTAAGLEYEILVEDRRGNPMVNDDFVASMFMALNANVFYNPASAAFYRRLADGSNGAFRRRNKKITPRSSGAYQTCRQQACHKGCQ